jgi:hypothetical protein
MSISSLYFSDDSKEAKICRTKNSRKPTKNARILKKRKKCKEMQEKSGTLRVPLS